MSVRRRRGRGRRPALAPVLVLVLTALLTLTGVAAPVADATSTGPVTDRIAQTWGVNGRVLDLVPLGDSVVVAGDFTAVSSVDGTTRPAGRVAVYDARTGRFTNTVFDFDKEVDSIAVVGDVLYAGGKFSTVGGVRSRFVAAVSMTTGKPVAGFSATPDKPVDVVRPDGGSLYVGGRFTAVTDGVGPHAQPFLARLSSTTGRVDTSFAPVLDDAVHAVVPTSDGIYVGGDFTTVGGSGTYARVVRLSPTTARPDPGFVVGPTNLNARAPVSSLTLDGPSLLLGTRGSGGACALVDAGTGALRWSKHTNGDVVGAGFMGSLAYCGGHFSGPGAFDGLDRKKVAAVDRATGATTSWAPGVNSALGVFALAVGPDALYVGGDFTRVDNVDQEHLGQFRAVDAILAPTAVDSLDALAGDARVQLSWPSPSSDGGSALLPYRVYRDQGAGTWTLVGQTAERTFTDTTAANGVTYQYAVQARSSAGAAPLSPVATARPFPGGVTVPTAPVGFSAVGNVGVSLLSWSPPTSDGGSPVTGYTVYRRVASGVRAPLVTLPAGTTSYVDADVQVGTRYYYTVTASNVAGEGPESLEASAEPNSGVPSAPVLSLVSVSSTAVSLSWTVPTYSPTPITKYVLVRDAVKIATPSPTMLSFTDTTVVPGQRYTYQVRAVNSYGSSKWSNSVVVTVP